MSTREPLRFLVFALPLMLVLFACLMGVGSLFRALQDAAVARALHVAAAFVGVMLLVDLVLLVGILGFRAIADEERED